MPIQLLFTSQLLYFDFSFVFRAVAKAVRFGATDEWLLGVMLSAPFTATPPTPPLSTSFFWFLCLTAKGNWKRDAPLFGFSLFLCVFPHFPLVEIWIPLGWCWCEQLSPRWQTLEIKPRPRFRPGPSKDGRLLCPFYSISVSLCFLKIPFSLLLSSSLYFFTPQLWFSFLPLFPLMVSFSLQ